MFRKRRKEQLLWAAVGFVACTSILFSSPAAPLLAQPAAESAIADVPPQNAADQAAANQAARGLEVVDGRLIRVRLPLVGNADEHVKGAIRRALDKLTAVPGEPGRRPILILEFAPARRDEGFGAGSDYSRALSLAKFLTSREVAPVKTVAYVPRAIKGHGVLVALACEEIVMHPDAEIGEAGIDEAGGQIADDTINYYRDVARMRRPAFEALVAGMLDRRQEVLKVETDIGPEFVLRSELDELKSRRNIASQEVLFPAGAQHSVSGREGRDMDFVQLLASNSDELAARLALLREAVVEDQSLIGDWRPVMITVDQPISRRTVRQLETLIGAELKQHGVNWIGVQIDSGGGELAECLRLAEILAGLREKNEVQTVAYVPVEAGGGAAIVALACEQLVMHPDARLGGKEPVFAPEEGEVQDAVTSIRKSLAKNAGHSWSLLESFIDPQQEVFTYHNTQTGAIRYFSDAEAAAQENKNDWRKGAQIKPAGELLELTSERARELDISWQVVSGFEEFKQLYGFETDPREARPNWALELVEALAHPALAVLLLMIGFIGIYVELHTPGIGAGAFVSAVAFLLYFWSNFLHGTAAWLEILLFLAGLFFLALEVLALPGFGIFGLGGGVLILVALVLASQTSFIPRSESQVAELRQSLSIVTAAMVGTIIGAIALRRYLPHAPVFRTIILNPTPEEDLVDLDHRESVAEFSHLVGQQGTTTTKLMPAGKADFDGRLVDVIAEGVPIERGEQVVVVKARGSRVVVRAVNL